ncbi:MULTISPECIES: CCA tRNA nucleotidyltransferase [unclassified Gemella]|uniref:CCA tRNA nucleotidyltransferase n=1 Tax=unclassified Gemella TaxID=2624949 RepID=UPI001C0540AF|nr:MULTISPECIES: CCA tRNA nucleotidyltransferase [unclassified Gemella]MBU0278357.1 CCA tRNA nucleotidyltransferase [Gemella sp. zg-1178]QWQ39488.1 CCA tRNA nucleotidyltransferase [Gemella sp. zg-570]
MQECLDKNFKDNFSNAIPILEILENHGYLAYFVGGCVRDYLLGKKFSDIDITTSAKPEEIKLIFPKTFDTGIKHGTVTVIFNKQQYEITTFRSEKNYIQHRFPEDVEFITSLPSDLERRDFTINAMTLDKNGNLLDLYSGKSDLSNKIIRTVNEANERFNEDALRMLRAFRFVAKLNFSIDQDTYLAICKNKELIKFISIERIVAEFKKLFQGCANKHAMKLIIESELNKYIPFFNKVKEYTDFCCFKFEQAIFYLLDKNNIEFADVKKLKLSKDEYKEIKNYITIKEMFEENTPLKNILYSNNIEDVLFIIKIYNFCTEEDILNINLPIKSFTDIDIDNKQIMQIFPNKKPGSWIKDINKIVVNAILDGILENKNEKIKEFIKKEVRL